MEDREAPDDDGNWVTVGARPRQRAAPPQSAPTHTAAGGRKKRHDQSATSRRAEPRENQGEWQLVMRSRQALTKLRDEDFALTRLGQIHPGEQRRPNPRPVNRSRLGAKFPTSMASDRPNRPPAVLKRPARPAMPKFDVPLRSETDFPSLRGKQEPVGPPAATTERRRSSVALKLDESLRSMAGAAAQQSESAASPAPPMPPPPTIRTVAYSEAVSWRPRPARKSERRDLVRGEIREDVAMLQTAAAQTSTTESPPAVTDASAGSTTTTSDSPQKKKEKEKRLLKKAKKKESELIRARLNASKDTHVQLVTADAFERLHGTHGARWRRSQAEAVDLRAADQYPSLSETRISAAAISAAAASAAAAAASAIATQDSAQQDGPLWDGSQQEHQPADRRGGGVKTYSRMLRELPKTLPPPTDVRELVEAKDVKEAKRKAPKKRAPIETSIFDLAELASAQRTRRVEEEDECTSPKKPPPRRTIEATRLTGNRLDSSVLVHKRGKERLKKKKPSLLKRVILQERAERRRRLGLESAAAALLAGLTVREPEDGQQLKTGAVEGDSSAVAQSGGALAEAAEHVKIEVAPGLGLKQGITIPTQNAAASQRSVNEPLLQSSATGVTKQTSLHKPIVLLKKEPVNSAALPTTAETRLAVGSTPDSAQKATLKIKQEAFSSISPNNTAVEAKSTATSTPDLAQNFPVKWKERVSQISAGEDSLNRKPAEGSSMSSAQIPYAEAKQEERSEELDEKALVTPAIASVSDNTKASEPNAGGDSDEEAPPSRGPDYTPRVTVDPKVLIHSRKFREYCQQTLSPDIDESARLLLQDLTRFQDRLYNRDPIKARARRRLVFGLREVSKHLAIKKLACVILAPNIEKIETAGGLDQAVQRLLTLASEREVPLVFALKRRALGHACKKPVPVSCVGIFNYQGSEDNYKRMMQLAEAAQERYRAMVAEVEQALQPRPPQPELSPAEQLLGVIDGITRQQQPQMLAGENVTDDPTHSLLAKLRSVTLESPVSG